eukprot:CAMPEP_0202964654 /NCGR_PEP_ID=MMETSP1396-20130829/8733_1 /ASSEMBLY_ACC=CAM_ASM_000872 /TAXON_ID= /ORGANISM="Pseudokeronopsis sp., Strain Brazil" /LENGTH=190 /DNA_ID=CAMNT_0049686903 /DNA_START=289 /DNA_END=861 /DNA_ORIENTATION=-
MNSLLQGYNNLSCYLRFHMGLIGTQTPVDVREVRVKKYKDLIYLPPEKYYACEKLPKEWISLLVSQGQEFTGTSPLKSKQQSLSRVFSLESLPKRTLFKTYEKKVAGQREQSQPRQPLQLRKKKKRTMITMRNSQTTDNLLKTTAYSNKIVPDLKSKNSNIALFSLEPMGESVPFINREYEEVRRRPETS